MAIFIRSFTLYLFNNTLLFHLIVWLLLEQIFQTFFCLIIYILWIFVDIFVVFGQQLTNYVITSVSPL